MQELILEPEAQGISPIGVSRNNKQHFIDKSVSICAYRKRELAKLQKSKKMDEATTKRINRLEQIVTNLEQGIKRTQAAIRLGRPYGM